MKKVIIIGAGGHSAEIDEYICYNNRNGSSGKVSVVGFLDDNPDSYAGYRFSAPLLGGVKDHDVRQDCVYLIGIANLTYRRKFVELFLSKGAQFTNCVHATAYISESATIGCGVVIGPHANLGPNVKVGDYSLINSRCSMGHDTAVGQFNFISPNVCFSGFTSIGDGNLFGINCATIPGIIVGNENKIAAGMVLDKNVEDNSVVFYRYKERVIAVPK